MPSHAELSRVVSHALRHKPWVYEVELDEEGWAPVAELLDALRGGGVGWHEVTRADLVEMIAGSAKRRHEIDGYRVRALYGHSVVGRIAMVDAVPPVTLFHGTSPAAWALIEQHVLTPMRRQYVHMSVDVETAGQVGGRKSRSPLVLRVRAREAAQDGVRFFRGNEMVWLAHAVPATYLSVS